MKIIKTIVCNALLCLPLCAIFADSTVETNNVSEMVEANDKLEVIVQGVLYRESCLIHKLDLKFMECVEKTSVPNPYELEGTDGKRVKFELPVRREVHCMYDGDKAFVKVLAYNAKGVCKQDTVRVRTSAYEKSLFNERKMFNINDASPGSAFQWAFKHSSVNPLELGFLIGSGLQSIGTRLKRAQDVGKLKIIASSNDVVVVSYQSDRNGPEYKNISWLEVAVDTSRGYTPVSVCLYVGDELKSKSTINRLVDLGNGVWFPVQGTMESNYDASGAPGYITVLTTSEVSLSYDSQIDAFDLQPLPDYTVQNRGVVDSVVGPYEIKDDASGLIWSKALTNLNENVNPSQIITNTQN